MKSKLILSVIAAGAMFLNSCSIGVTEDTKTAMATFEASWVETETMANNLRADLTAEYDKNKEYVDEEAAIMNEIMPKIKNEARKTRLIEMHNDSKANLIALEAMKNDLTTFNAELEKNNADYAVWKKKVEKGEVSNTEAATTLIEWNTKLENARSRLGAWNTAYANAKATSDADMAACDAVMPSPIRIYSYSNPYIWKSGDDSIINKKESIDEAYQRINENVKGFCSAVVPDTMMIDSSYLAALTIGVKANTIVIAQTLSDAISTTSKKEAINESNVRLDSIRVDSIMIASLTDQSNDDNKIFIINGLTNDTQMVELEKANVLTTWQWSVKPLKKGNYPLQIIVKIFYKSLHSSKPSDITVYKRTIYVNAIEPTLGQIVVNLIKQYWQWLFTVLLIPIVKKIIGYYKKKQRLNSKLFL